MDKKRQKSYNLASESDKDVSLLKESGDRESVKDGKHDVKMENVAANPARSK